MRFWITLALLSEAVIRGRGDRALRQKKSGENPCRLARANFLATSE
jgi:hypothetical protein